MSRGDIDARETRPEDGNAMHRSARKKARPEPSRWCGDGWSAVEGACELAGAADHAGAVAKESGVEATFAGTLGAL